MSEPVPRPGDFGAAAAASLATSLTGVDYIGFEVPPGAAGLTAWLGWYAECSTAGCAARIPNPDYLAAWEHPDTIIDEALDAGWSRTGDAWYCADHPRTDDDE
jgi:hypothetical protein